MSMILHGTVSDNVVALDRKTVPPIFINGDMGIWQRGTALASSSGNYACDRFWYAGTGATSQRSTDVPSGFIYSNKLTYGSSDMSIGQPIELPATGKQGIFIAGQTVTIAFYGKVDSGTEAITVNINARNEKFSGTNSTSFTTSDNAVTLTTDWQRFTKTFTIPTINANNVMLAFELGGISKTAYFTGFQCELGTYDTNSIADFQFEDVGTSLARCQRYCRVYGTGEASYQQFGDLGVAINTTSAQICFPFNPEMRTIPSLSNSGNLGLGTGASIIAMTAIAINTNKDTRQSAGVTATVSSGLTAHKVYRIDQNNSSSSVVTFDAEL